MKCQIKLVSLLIFSFTIRAETIIVYGKKFEPDLRKSQNINDYIISHCIHRSLVKLAPNGVVQADVAKSWTISRDRTTYNFELKDLRFHNGKILKVQDVERSLKIALSGGSDVAVLLKNYVSSVSHEEDRLVIRLKRPFDQLLKAISTADFAIRSSRDDYVVGLGTFRVVEWRHKLALENVSDSKNKLNFEFSSDENTLIEKIRLADGVLGLPNQLAKKFWNAGVLKGEPQFENNLSFAVFLLNPSRDFTKSHARRSHLQSLVRKTSRNIASTDFHFLRWILPDGLLLRKDWQVKNAGLEKKWVGKLRVQFPRNWWPLHFKEDLEKTLKQHFEDLEIVETDSKDGIDFTKFDLIASDYILPFADPHLAVPGFDLGSFGIRPPTEFRELQDSVDQLVDLSGKDRVVGYTNAFHRFAVSGWAIPLFSQKFPIFLNRKFSAGEATYQFERVLCH